MELVPGGSSKAVTADNVVEYIHRVADYRLNYQIKAGSEAFWRGFFEVVSRDWVTMFNEEEVQMLISGGGEGVDIADMQAHVNYAGGYHEQHPVILEFWKASPLHLTALPAVDVPLLVQRPASTAAACASVCACFSHLENPYSATPAMLQMPRRREMFL